MGNYFEKALEKIQCFRETDYPCFKKKLVTYPHKLVVRNVSHFVVCTAIGQTFRLMTR